MVMRKKGVPLKKRGWAVQASLGPASLRFEKRHFKNAIDKEIKKVLHKEETPMHKTITEAILSSPLDNTIYTVNLLGNIPQGTAYNNRIGDEIFIEALKFRLYMANDATYQTSVYRVLIIKSREQVLQVSDAFGSGIGSTDLFFSTPSNAIVNGMIDAKRCTVLFDRQWDLNQYVPLQSTVKTFEATLPLKQKFVYETGTNYGKFQNLYLVVLANIYGGSTGTTNTGYLSFSSDMIFKNSL